MRLYELASTIRSKNAGVDHITFDIIFPDPATYRRAVECKAITKETVADVYGIPTDRIVSFVVYDAANAIKFTIRRRLPAGSPGEPDLFGSQCYPPLFDIEIS